MYCSRKSKCHVADDVQTPAPEVKLMINNQQIVLMWKSSRHCPSPVLITQPSVHSITTDCDCWMLPPSPPTPFMYCRHVNNSQAGEKNVYLWRKWSLSLLWLPVWALILVVCCSHEEVEEVVMIKAGARFKWSVILWRGLIFWSVWVRNGMLWLVDVI